MLMWHVHRGIDVQTDLLALLPREDRDVRIQRAKDRISESIGRRVLFMIGDRDAARAHEAGSELADWLQKSGMTDSVTLRLPADEVRSLGTVLFPYREGLLAAEDRARLEQGRASEIVDRALATVYGPIPVASVALLRNDPFFLLPSYLASLPSPLPRLGPDDGWLSVQDGSRTYVLVTAQLSGSVFSLDFQNRFVADLGATEARLRAQFPELVILRVGSVFYAQDAGKIASKETAEISLVSLVGTVLLILAVFRAIRPLLLCLLSIGVGVLCAFAVCLQLFGGLHVAALLFGVSLVGIATDYCLQFVAARFDVEAKSPWDRLRRVLPGISLGIATTLIGYVTLLLAPFPGLHQVAVFSAVGLAASFVTVLLWLPLLDSAEPLRHGCRMLASAGWPWRFWHERRYRWARLASVGVCTALTAAGLTRLHADDDVRHMQVLSERLRLEELEVRRLTGMGVAGEFLLVEGADEEQILQREEAAIDRLQNAHAISSSLAISEFIPSKARQRDNRGLVREKLLAPFLASYYARIGIEDRPAPPPEESPFLTPMVFAANSSLAFLRNLTVNEGSDEVAHLVLLNDVPDPSAVAAAVTGMEGVRIVDPTGDVTRLLRAYRIRAMILIAVSAVLMLPIVLWRYGRRGTPRVVLPPILAVLLAPPLAALFGVTFTFFSAMALVLVLSIAFDYAVFCREARPPRIHVVMIGIWLAMAATLLSFGLLAFSRTTAASGFGTTLLIGTLLACLISPLADNSDPS